MTGGADVLTLAAAPRPDGASVQPHLAPGQRLSDTLTVVEHLRRGEELDVYVAFDTARYCRVLAKTTRPELASWPDTVAALTREADVLAGFAHPHVVRLFEVQRPRGEAPVVVLELLTGATLGALLKRVGRLSLPDLAAMGEQLCSALRYVHASGVLHLDVKPSNIICDNRLAKLIDFSVARAPGPCPRGLGTPTYAAPEQVAGGLASSASDVWGLGLCLYQSATGAHPFEPGVHTGDHSPDRAPSIRSLRRLPAVVSALLDGCLEPEPGNRPSLTEVATILSAHRRT